MPPKKTPEEGSLTLTFPSTGKKDPSVLVKSSWLPRWEALSNLVEDMGTTSLEWTRHTKEELTP